LLRAGPFVLFERWEPRTFAACLFVTDAVAI
jgi:hypothetical protein